MVRTVKDPETRKAEIILAARRLFQTRDYEKTTMQDVMDELGIAKGTIYYYFKSKEELLDAVIDQMSNEAYDKMEQVVKHGKGNALELIQQLIAAGNISDENPELLDHLHNPSNSGMHTTMLATAIKQTAPLYAQVIRQGVEEGLFNVDNPLETAEFLLTAVQFLLDTGIYQWTQDDLMRRSIAFPGVIETLVQAKPGSFQFLFQQGN
ncbi:MAG: TetR/AcrR family transcriptional regulator [Leptolinea sp.]|nr:TetR/AcrR family transcriptional regulator [Leptolinea sp.]